MSTHDVWNVLSGIPAGTIVAWATVIIAIVTAICAGLKKIHKVYIKYKEQKDKYDTSFEMVRKHEEVLNDIKESLNEIKGFIDEDKGVQKRRLKHDITKMCNRAIEQGHVTMSILRSIEEMFTDYKDIYHGNSWVETLIKKVEQLPIIEDIPRDE